jgi:hypothetical protein
MPDTASKFCKRCGELQMDLAFRELPTGHRSSVCRNCERKSASDSHGRRRVKAMLAAGNIGAFRQ